VSLVCARCCGDVLTIDAPDTRALSKEACL